MKIFAVVLLVAHYVLPLMAFLIKKLPHDFASAVTSYIITLIGLYVMVCMMPEFLPLRIWLIASTIICVMAGVLGAGDYKGDSGPGCLLLIPGIIGAIICMAVLE